ncbi:MAG: hypothetical protein JNM63_11770 [Spirochaetia bacterium]|nr:hypothetical protein [Spirochaetia bacterium]
MKKMRLLIFVIFLGWDAAPAAPLKVNLSTGWGLFPLPPPDTSGFYPGSFHLVGGPLGHLGATLFFGEHKVRAGLGLEAGCESWLYYKALSSEQSEWLYPIQALFQLETGVVSFQIGMGPGIYQRRVLTSEKVLLQETQVVPSTAFSILFDLRLGKNILLPVGLRVAGMIAPGAGSTYSPMLRLLLTPTIGIAFRF